MAFPATSKHDRRPIAINPHLARIQYARVRSNPTVMAQTAFCSPPIRSDDTRQPVNAGTSKNADVRWDSSGVRPRTHRPTTHVCLGADAGLRSLS